MPTSRLEAFSDGVLAIVITIMVLELHAPRGHDWRALGDVSSQFGTYALSFVYIGIYWNNHHHMFHVVQAVTGAVLWANLHLLFWLSLVPFSTTWMDESGFAEVPTVVYGLNFLLAAVAYFLVQRAVIAGPGGTRLASALGRDLKGKLSPVIYLVGIALTFVEPWIGVTVFVLSAFLWLVPDRRMERMLSAGQSREP